MLVQHIPLLLEVVARVELVVGIIRELPGIALLSVVFLPHLAVVLVWLVVVLVFLVGRAAGHGQAALRVLELLGKDILVL